LGHNFYELKLSNHIFDSHKYWQAEITIKHIKAA